MRLRLFLLLNAAAALLVVGTQPVLAQERWEIFIEDAAPSGAPCVTAADLASSTNALTGAALTVLAGPPAERRQVEHLIAGRLTRANDQVMLVLALHDASGVRIGERVFERPAAQCDCSRSQS